MKAKTDVYRLLKEKIQFLDLEPGSKIIETDLGEEFGVSRTPIREALKKLQEEQLIDIYPQRGTYVSKINFNTVRQITYMRHVVETDIFYGLCHEKKDLTLYVAEPLALMELAYANGDYKKYIGCDADFHRAIFGCAGKEFVWHILSNYLAHYTRVLTLEMKLPNELRQSYESHLEIVSCIKAGDIEGLTILMDTHHDHNMTEDEIKKKTGKLEYFE